MSNAPMRDDRGWTVNAAQKEDKIKPRKCEIIHQLVGGLLVALPAWTWVHGASIREESSRERHHKPPILAAFSSGSRVNLKSAGKTPSLQFVHWTCPSLQDSHSLSNSIYRALPMYLPESSMSNSSFVVSLVTLKGQGSMIVCLSLPLKPLVLASLFKWTPFRKP